MSIYQALQLNAAGSKELIKNAADKREKRKWTLVYLLKILLTVIFCTGFVTVYSLIFGPENSIAGVVVLLAVLVLRFADFGIHARHGVAVIFLTFAILAVGPYAAGQAGLAGAFLINSLCLLALLILNCHNVIMFNHATFVLGYLLLLGYEVDGHAYKVRVFSLFLGAVLCAFIFYKNHRHLSYKRSFGHLFREFDLSASRTQWYLRLSLGVSSSLLAAGLLHLPRPMWVGVSAMSVMLPFTQDLVYRLKRRLPFGAIGCGLFAILYMVLPESMLALIGTLGGIGVGFSATYSWQTIFNTFGALAVAVGLLGFKRAIFHRILALAAGSVYGACFHWVMNQAAQRLRRQTGGIRTIEKEAG